MHIHSMWRMWNTLYLFHIYVGAHLNEPIWAADESSGNMVRTDTYAHQQHVKDVKYLIFDSHWCWSPFEWVYGLRWEQRQHGKNIHMHIHSIWRMWNTLYLFHIDDWCWSPFEWVYSQMRAAATWQGQIHMHIHSIWWMWNTIYLIHIHVGAHLKKIILNYHTMPLVDPEDVNKIWGNFHKLGKWEQQQHGKDRYICTSTANEGCETPYMCLPLLLKPIWMGL